jgi:hypothetical protein
MKQLEQDEQHHKEEQERNRLFIEKAKMNMYEAPWK